MAQMNWLYFFMGCTAAWVFMGLVLFGADVLRKVFIKEPAKEPLHDELVNFWDFSNRTAKERNALLEQINISLRDISLTIYGKN